jgi:cobalt/nickel transport system permease protein
MLPVWATSVKKVKEELPKEKLPLLGVGAAFSFLMMMYDVPLPGGTTGHAVGAMLIAVLLGPFSACISVTAALLVQALFFGDGGLLAFGANCFNMAFVLPFTGHYVYRFIKEKFPSKKGEYAGIMLGSYVGLNLAALCAAIEFGLQPLLFKNAAGQPLYCPYDLSVSIPSMMSPHLLVAGIVELAFTVAIFAYIKRFSPNMVGETPQQKAKPIYGLLLALIVLTPLGLLAQGTAWGEWGIEEIKEVVSGGTALGYIPEGMKNGFGFQAIIQDYVVKGLPEIAGYLLSAFAGTVILVMLFKIVSGLKKNKISS